MCHKNQHRCNDQPGLKQRVCGAVGACLVEADGSHHKPDWSLMSVKPSSVSYCESPHRKSLLPVSPALTPSSSSALFRIGLLSTRRGGFKSPAGLHVSLASLLSFRPQERLSGAEWLTPT
uniref:Uncharacterized protein n=1 Tax=Knipowitschia caucasica TaxID=637954 RepID=A0AAV2J2R3_KNICA